MRKHDVRKWLHAILDLLPVILIPVFMIYSHRHTIDSGTIDVPQNQVIDFNQKIELNTNNFSGLYGRPTLTDNVFSITLETPGYNQTVYNLPNLYFDSTHKYIIDVDIKATDTINFIVFDNTFLSNFSSSSFSHQSFLVSTPRDRNIIFRKTASNVDLSFTNFMLFDLTQMFGSGNEPTLEEFNTWFTQDYYDYILSHKELLKGTSIITYDDTDIMSQVVYQLYNSVDKYFNMGNVFNMTGVYDWFNLNIFNGNAPISIYIVWNIVLYEFVMDLLFLLYGLFMWFIDMVEKLMEKPLKSVK